MPATDQDTTKAAPPDTGRLPLPIFGLGQQQRSPFISSVKRVNCVVETTPNGRQQTAIVGLPGLEIFVDTGAIPIRGIISIDNISTFIAAIGDQIVRISANSSPVTVGTLTTNNGPVWIDTNGKELFINDGATPILYNLSTQTISPVNDIDYPAGARGGVFLQQRFWVYVPSTDTTGKAGRVYGSNQLDGSTWDPLNFFTPESVPDGIVAIARWFNDLMIFGVSSIEWWSGSSDTLPGLLGFHPITGANTEVGLVAERGFAATDQVLMFVGKGNGQTGIYKINGYSAEKISPPLVDDELNKRPSHTIAICTAYTVGGHPIFQVTLPSDANADVSSVTLIHDSLNDMWSYRESFALPYYRGLLAVSSGDDIFITDAFEGSIYRMKDSVYTEGNDPLIFEVTSIHIIKNGDMISIDQIQIDMEVGRGTPVGQGDIPRGIIQISKDGGQTWGSEKWVNIGKIGEFRRRATRNRMGAARDFAVRFRVTDPVPRRVTGAYLKMTPGKS